ncbi:hypothetical protein Daesc_005822 [Daldinia eschscholtzii]|uniref:DUF221-domain-containing protein n=1 Tax=Daldinia eschscholtzii TaxID=292717 RepID=A0AAX6MM89_9PEZI
MPVNATGGGSSTELDKIGIGNVREKGHLYAHAIIACVFFGFVMFTVARERLWLIGLRQAWTLSKPVANRLSSRTVLFLSAPRDALDEDNMQRYFGDDALRIWPATEVDALESLVSKRKSKIEKLEAAEMALIRKANREGRKLTKSRPQNEHLTYNDLQDSVKKSIRPRHKLDISPLNEKVDTIEWLREKIKEEEASIEAARNAYEIGDTHGAAAVFVEFRTCADAQRACQQVASSNVLALAPRFTGVSPQEVIWKNLAIPPARRISEEGTALTIVIALIIFWSIPSGIIGLISNIGYLANNVEWLSFLKDLPEPVIGLLSGLIPPLATSWLSKLVPSIFRYIFKSTGSPTNTAAELKAQKWYYIFQVTQVFLVTTVFSGAAPVAAQLMEKAKDPTSIPELLAKQLPKASNFYLTYFIIQGTTSAADNLLNYSDLLSYLLYDYFFDKTPRQKFNRYTSMKGIAWGKLFPKYLAPLEQFLPADLASLAERDDESAPLLASAEEGQAQSTSRIQQLAQQANVPKTIAQRIIDPIARFFEPQVFTSYQAMRSWLREGDLFNSEEDVPEYTEEQVEKAYLNPALTSPTPLIWIAKDPMGVSQNEITENEKCGLKTSDQGAWLDERGKLRWSVQEFEEVPIWKRSVIY